MQCCCANQATDVWLTSWTSDLWLLLLFGPGHVEVQRRLLQHSCAVLISNSYLLEANCTVSFASATSLKCGTSSKLLVLLILCRLFFWSRTLFSVPISYLVGECWFTQWLCANQEAPGAFQQLEVLPDKAEWVLRACFCSEFWLIEVQSKWYGSLAGMALAPTQWSGKYNNTWMWKIVGGGRGSVFFFACIS